MRLFIGVWLSETMRDEVVRYINLAMKESQGFKWSNPEQLHFTLKFLGEVETEKVADLIKALETAAIGKKPFQLRLGETGCFPARGIPRVLWIGLASAQKELEMLAGAIDAVCNNLGFPAEKKVFKPHLTIARVKNRPGERIITPNLKLVWQSTTLVSGFSLIESRLNPQGSVYRVVKEFSFQQRNPTGFLESFDRY
jgi:2'-5' RNA ligase